MQKRGTGYGPYSGDYQMPGHGGTRSPFESVFPG